MIPRLGLAYLTTSDIATIHSKDHCWRPLGVRRSVLMILYRAIATRHDYSHLSYLSVKNKSHLNCQNSQIWTKNWSNFGNLKIFKNNFFRTLFSLPGRKLGKWIGILRGVHCRKISPFALKILRKKFQNFWTHRKNDPVKLRTVDDNAYTYITGNDETTVFHKQV